MVQDSLLAEQMTYYRQRASEYDEWWERKGRYDRGEELTARWFAERDVVRSAFDGLPLDGHVLELAPGTGYWTDLLARRAASVTAIDGSAEMIELNRARLGDLATNVTYQEADLFEWKPDQCFGGLVFCFWISHVPRDRLAAFLATCREALSAGAPMFFLDGQAVPETTANNHVLPEADSEVMTRKLNDGREFQIVKNFYDPAELVSLGNDAGFDLSVHHTDTFFQYGIGVAR